MKSNKFFSAVGIILLFISTNSFYSQQIDMELFKALKPRSIGPAGMSGRVTSIDVVLKNLDIIYVGTASGGLWRSTSRGTTWEPIFDDQNAASIGAVAVDQNVPDIIWVGTGEGNPRNSQTSGNGVYKSIDGGKTWKHLGLENTRNIHKLIIDPTNSNTVYVAAQGSAWGESKDRGIFKTTDGGKSWHKVLYVDEKTGAADFIIDPSNPNKLIAAMWQFRRWPWFFKSGGPGSGIYISFDAGETWQIRTDKDGLPKGELGRVGLAISRNRTNIIYALVEAKKNGLYRSEDGGFKWQLVTEENVSNRPFYYHEIHVDPQNENRIYNLFSSITYSEDGGKTFKTLGASSNVHPDHHAWWINPNDPNYIINGNDGGLAISNDRGLTWRFVGNLPLGQFYHINVDNEFPYNVYGGLQDNGSFKGPNRVFHRGGISNSFWEEVGFGDGFDTAADIENPRYVYHMSQGGNLGRYDCNTGDRKNIRPVHPEGNKLRFNWNAGFSQDPFNPTTIYYGSQYLHKSSNRGDSWEIISPDLTTNDPQKQKQLDSGGLTFDVTNAENFTTIISIALSPIKQGIIWVGTDDGNLQLSKDGGKSWENVIKNIKGVPNGSWVPQVRASVYIPEEAFVVINNYRRDDWKPYVFRTTDFGKTWNPIVKETDVYGYALSFLQDPIQKNLFFLGTEFGLYFSINEGKSWTKWTQGYPTVSSMDIAIQSRESDLVVGTFGRSIYVFDDIRPLRNLAKEGISMLDKKLKLFEIRDSYQLAVKQIQGMHFPASAEYFGDNLPFGAMITFYISPDTSKGDDKLKLEIYDSGNKLIRTLSPKFEKGFNRIFWGLERRGIRMPGGFQRFREEREDAEPSGPQVLPGTYKVKITYRKQIDSAYVKVSSDPRLDVKFENLVERDKLIREFEKKVEVVTNGNSRIQDAGKIILLVEEKIKGKKDSSFVSLGKTAKALKDSLKSLNELINQPQVQGIRSDDSKLGSKIRTAYFSIAGYWDKIGDGDKVNLKIAEDAMDPVISKINTFFEMNWVQFRNEVERLKISIFDDYKKLEFTK